MRIWTDAPSDLKAHTNRRYLRIYYRTERTKVGTFLAYFALVLPFILTHCFWLQVLFHFGSPSHGVLTRPHGIISHVSLRSFARHSSPSAAMGDDPVPGRLCSRYSRAVYPCNRHRQALGFCVVSCDVCALPRRKQPRYRAIHSAIRSPQLPSHFPGSSEQRPVSLGPLRVTEAGNRPRSYLHPRCSCSHPPASSPLPTSFVRRVKGETHVAFLRREEGPPAVASTALTRSVPAVASTARPAGTQYASCTIRATCTVPPCSTSWPAPPA